MLKGLLPEITTSSRRRNKKNTKWRGYCIKRIANFDDNAIIFKRRAEDNSPYIYIDLFHKNISRFGVSSFVQGNLFVSERCL